jgi:pyocin large subunit-like protein
MEVEMGGWGGGTKNENQSSKYQKNGFPIETLDRHFEIHGSEFDAKNAAEYEALAIKFRDDTSEKGIEQFVNYGYCYKYDRRRNFFLIFKENGEIVTLYKPDDGIHYWKKQVADYGPK